MTSSSTAMMSTRCGAVPGAAPSTVPRLTRHRAVVASLRERKLLVLVAERPADSAQIRVSVAGVRGGATVAPPRIRRSGPERAAAPGLRRVAPTSPARSPGHLASAECRASNEDRGSPWKVGAHMLPGAALCASAQPKPVNPTPPCSGITGC